MSDREPIQIESVECLMACNVINRIEREADESAGGFRDQNKWASGDEPIDQSAPHSLLSIRRRLLRQCAGVSSSTVYVALQSSSDKAGRRA